MHGRSDQRSIVERLLGVGEGVAVRVGLDPRAGGALEEAPGVVAREVRLLDIEQGRPVREQSLFSEVEARVRDVRFGPDGAVYLLLPDRIVRITPADAGD